MRPDSSSTGTIFCNIFGELSVNHHYYTVVWNDTNSLREAITTISSYSNWFVLILKGISLERIDEVYSQHWTLRICALR